MMGSYISVQVTPGKYEHFKVPDEVYVYIKQLEMAIKYDASEAIKQRYPERFSRPDIINQIL